MLEVAEMEVADLEAVDQEGGAPGAQTLLIG